MECSIEVVSMEDSINYFIEIQYYNCIERSRAHVTYWLWPGPVGREQGGAGGKTRLQLMCCAFAGHSVLLQRWEKCQSIQAGRTR
jgi:hypothetical protein